MPCYEHHIIMSLNSKVLAALSLFRTWLATLVTRRRPKTEWKFKILKKIDVYDRNLELVMSTIVAWKQSVVKKCIKLWSHPDLGSDSAFATDYLWNLRQLTSTLQLFITLFVKKYIPHKVLGLNKMISVITPSMDHRGNWTLNKWLFP